MEKEIEYITDHVPQPSKEQAIVKPMYTLADCVATVLHGVIVCMRPDGTYFMPESEWD